MPTALSLGCMDEAVSSILPTSIIHLPSVNEAEESLPPKPSQTAKTDYSGSVAMAGAELYSFIYIPHRKAVTNQLAEHCLTVS